MQKFNKWIGDEKKSWKANVAPQTSRSWSWERRFSPVVVDTWVALVAAEVLVCGEAAHATSFVRRHGHRFDALKGQLVKLFLRGTLTLGKKKPS